MTGLSALRRYTGGSVPPARAGGDLEHCELCRVRVGSDHPHVVDVQQRRLCCACQACALLFSSPGSSRGLYRTVPDRVLADPEATLTQAQWTALEIPVRMAFFFFNSSLGRWVASYPSPAGATESLLELPAWSRLAAENSLIQKVEPDVEALLVRGDRNGVFESFLVPIVACYALVGIVRKSWRGFDGGDAFRAEIETFFERLRNRSRAP